MSFNNHSLTFLLSQEILTSAQTLHIDCSAAGIKMEEGKKIFEGSTINIHWFLLKKAERKNKKILLEQITEEDI